MNKPNQFKIGDKVNVGWDDNKNSPTIQFTTGSDHISWWERGEVITADKDLFTIKLLDIVPPIHWIFAQPNYDPGYKVWKEIGYPLLISVPEEIEEIKPQIVWKEFVCPESFINVPKIVLDELIDKGERGIRRTLRAWPIGLDLKHKLIHQPTGTYIEWYWENTNEMD